MTVLFSHWPGSPTLDAILPLARSSWHRNGWNSAIINLSLANAHPAFPHLQAAFDATSPPPAQRDFEWLCFTRFLAAASQARSANFGPFWLSDADVLNHHFTPALFRSALHPHNAILAGGGALGFSSPSAADTLCAALHRFIPQAIPHTHPPTFASDITTLWEIANNSPPTLAWSPPIQQIHTPDCFPSLPLLHLAGNTCPNRVALASRYLKEWGATGETSPLDTTQIQPHPPTT